jgi:histidyl-tRNA synthetase
VTIWNEESVGESLKLAGELRQTGLRVLVYPEADKLGKQFKYADSIGIKHAIIMRDEEIAENKVKVKNLQTSVEEAFAREEVAAKVKELIG